MVSLGDTEWICLQKLNCDILNVYITSITPPSSLIKIMWLSHLLIKLHRSTMYQKIPHTHIIWGGIYLQKSYIYHIFLPKLGCVWEIMIYTISTLLIVFLRKVKMLKLLIYVKLKKKLIINFFLNKSKINKK